MSFSRNQGEGFYPSSVKTMEATAAVPFADGYVSQGRGQLRGGKLFVSGMPVAGAPVVVTITDGPGGDLLWSIPLYGTPTIAIDLDIPFKIEAGVYITGLAAVVGTQIVSGMFIHEVNEPGPQPQAEPK